MIWSILNTKHIKMSLLFGDPEVIEEIRKNEEKQTGAPMMVQVQLQGL